MTFLQPQILWALPLVLLPVIIHLINRLRHRPQPWAAMRFLVAATQSSTSQAKLRQWLILLFRTLAVLMLILFLGRPLAGGWLGWSVNSAPDAIVILLDRSVSMETKLAGRTITRREQALESLSQAAEPFSGRSHLVVIDSALRRAQPLARPSDLRELPVTAATDTATDMPALLQTAITWLEENQTGTAEFWIVSDLQRTNWKPDDERWHTLQAQLAALQQRLRVRLLGVASESDADTAATLQDVVRTDREDLAELLLTVDIQRTQDGAVTLPVAVNLNGTPAQYDVAMEGGNLRWRQRLNLGSQRGSGWGYVETPADANARNNRAWFVYGPPASLRTTVVTEDSRVGRWLSAAASAAPPGARREFRVISPGELSSANFEGDVLILWQAALPDADAGLKLEGFVQSGGVLVFLPPGKADAGRFAGQSWGALQPAADGEAYQVARWEEREGPLAKTEEGFSLPLASAEIHQRQPITGDAPALASFADGAALLTRQTMGRGHVYYLSSLPLRDWSTLGNGPVLVPMIQRLLESGSRRLTQATLMQAGDLSAVDEALPWQKVEGSGTSPQLDAGIYRAGERLTAINRAAGEETSEPAAREEINAALAGVNLQWFEETGRPGGRLQGEVWRLFVAAMLAFLLVESFLVLPPKPSNIDVITGRSVKRRMEEMVEADK